MKFKTTAKALRDGCLRIVSAGYCDLQYLLRTKEPIAYTSGVYGWNFDVYEIDGLTICTGYRGMVGRRANNIHEYEQKAKKIWNNYNLPWALRENLVNNFLAEFVKQAEG